MKHASAIKDIQNIIDIYYADKDNFLTSPALTNATQNLLNYIYTCSDSNIYTQEQSNQYLYPYIDEIKRLFPAIFNFNELFKINESINEYEHKSHSRTLTYKYSNTFSPLFFSLLLHLMPNDIYPIIKREIDQYINTDIEKNTSYTNLYHKQYKQKYEQMLKESNIDKISQYGLHKKIIRELNEDETYQNYINLTVFESNSTKDQDNTSNFLLSNQSKVLQPDTENSQLYHIPYMIDFYIDNYIFITKQLPNINNSGLPHALNGFLGEDIKKYNIFKNYSKDINHNPYNLYVFLNKIDPKLLFNNQLITNSVSIYDAYITSDDFLESLIDTKIENKAESTILENYFTLSIKAINENPNTCLSNDNYTTSLKYILEFLKKLIDIKEKNNQDKKDNYFINNKIHDTFTYLSKITESIKSKSNYKLLQDIGFIKTLILIEKNNKQGLSYIISNNPHSPFNEYLKDDLYNNYPELYFQIDHFFIQTTNLNNPNKPIISSEEIDGEIIFKANDLGYDWFEPLEYYNNHKKNNLIDNFTYKYLKASSPLLVRLQNLNKNDGKSFMSAMEQIFTKDQILLLINIYFTDNEQINHNINKKLISRIKEYVKLKLKSHKSDDEKIDIYRKIFNFLPYYLKDGICNPIISKVASTPIYDPFNIFPKNNEILSISYSYLTDDKIIGDLNLSTQAKNYKTKTQGYLFTNPLTPYQQNNNNLYIEALKSQVNYKELLKYNTDYNANNRNYSFLKQINTQLFVHLYQTLYKKVININNVDARLIYNALTFTGNLDQKTYNLHDSLKQESIHDYSLRQENVNNYQIELGVIDTCINCQQYQKDQNIHFNPILFISLFGTNLIQNLKRIYSQLNDEEKDNFTSSLFYGLSNSSLLLTNMSLSKGLNNLPPNENQIEENNNYFNSLIKNFAIEIADIYQNNLSKTININKVISTHKNIPISKLNEQPLSLDTALSHTPYSSIILKHWESSPESVSLKLINNTNNTKDISNRQANSQGVVQTTITHTYLAHTKADIEEIINNLLFNIDEKPIKSDVFTEEIYATIQCKTLQDKITSQQKQNKNINRL